jgi:hypothetical protein
MLLFCFQAAAAAGAPKQVAEIAWRDEPDFLAKNVFNKQNPVLITGSPADLWRAHTSFTYEYLEQQSSLFTLRNVLSLRMDEPPYFPYFDKTFPMGSIDGIDFQPPYTLSDIDKQDFFHTLKGCPGDDNVSLCRHVYLSTSLSDFSPELLGDVNDGGKLLGSAQPRMNIWLSSANATAWPHFDSSHNLFVQVRGRKAVWLAPTSYWTKGSFSRLHVAHRQLSLTPAQFAASAKFGTFVEEGQMLYIPPLYFHQVQTLDGPSVSVNVFHSATALSEAIVALFELLPLPLPRPSHDSGGGRESSASLCAVDDAGVPAGPLCSLDPLTSKEEAHFEWDLEHEVEKIALAASFLWKVVTVALRGGIKRKGKTASASGDTDVDVAEATAQAALLQTKDDRAVGRFFSQLSRGRYAKLGSDPFLPGIDLAMLDYEVHHASDRLSTDSTKPTGLCALPFVRHTTGWSSTSNTTYAFHLEGRAGEAGRLLREHYGLKGSTGSSARPMLLADFVEECAAAMVGVERAVPLLQSLGLCFVALQAQATPPPQATDPVQENEWAGSGAGGQGRQESDDGTNRRLDPGTIGSSGVGKGKRGAAAYGHYGYGPEGQANSGEVRPDGSRGRAESGDRSSGGASDVWSGWAGAPSFFGDADAVYRHAKDTLNTAEEAAAEAEDDLADSWNIIRPARGAGAYWF